MAGEVEVVGVVVRVATREGNRRPEKTVEVGQRFQASVVSRRATTGPRHTAKAEGARLKSKTALSKDHSSVEGRGVRYMEIREYPSCVTP